jgi:hypothetical protein
MQSPNVCIHRMPKAVRWNDMWGALLRRAITHASEFERGVCRSSKPRVGHVKFHSLQLLILFRAKSFASRYTSAFAPSAGPKPTCALLLASMYVSLSMGTTPVLAQPVKTSARITSHVFMISPLGAQRLNMLTGIVSSDRLRTARDSCACSIACQCSP